MTMKKDYNLLHPFDLEAAKRGEPFGLIDRGELLPREYIAGPDDRGWICIKYQSGKFDICDPDQYYMIPLTWVEGKPVYKGDVLWHTTAVKVTAARERNDDIDGFICTDGDYVSAKFLSWTPPKVKREGWIAVSSTKQLSPFVACVSHAYVSREEAERSNTGYPIVHIEWEEPA